TETPVNLDDICDAILLGWSIVELRSRVTIAVLAPILTFVAQSDPESPSPDQPDPHVNRAMKVIDDLKSDMFSLDVLNRLQTAASSGDANQADRSEVPNDDMWVTSIWRTLFNRVVSLHLKYFPESNTRGTAYDITLNSGSLSAAY